MTTRATRRADPSAKAPPGAPSGHDGGAAAKAFFHARFTALGAAERAVAQRAYMKSALRFHGVDTPTLRAAAADYLERRSTLDRADLRATVDALFASDWFDLRSAALALLERRGALLSARDAGWLVSLVRRAGCWAHVDWIAKDILGALIERHPALLDRSRQWARDADLWVRRTALLCQLRALRRGEGDFALFESLAVPMLAERGFFVRKAIGWVLRDVAKRRPALVERFLARHGADCSALTRREAERGVAAGRAAVGGRSTVGERSAPRRRRRRATRR